MHFEDKHPELKISNAGGNSENVQVVVKILGREALPVWVLPYVTGWNLSPDMLLDRLVNPHHDPTASFPAAFQVGASNNSMLIPREQWEGIYIKVKSIDEQLTKEGLTLFHDRDEWRRRSIAELSRHQAYVWLDEFQGWFNKQLYAHNTLKIGDHGSETEGPGVEICLYPFLPQELATCFKEEIKSLAAEMPNDTATPLDTHDRQKLEETNLNNG